MEQCAKRENSKKDWNVLAVQAKDYANIQFNIFVHHKLITITVS